MSFSEKTDEILPASRWAERARAIGFVLRAYGEYYALGHREICAVLDILATQIEHDEPSRRIANALSGVTLGRLR